MRNSIHIAILCLVSLFAAGCDKSVTDAPEDEKDVWVDLNIGIALSDSAVPERSSRADHEGPADEAEKMQTLRIVVVNKDGNVEANRFLYAGSVVEYGEEHFKVRANETKQVYVFVNEKNKSVNVYDAAGDPVADFHAYLGGIGVGAPFPRTEIEGLEVRLNDGVGSELDAAGGGYEDAAGGLPMSTCETVEVGDTDLSHKISLHRAAVKFTFNITNQSGRERALTGLHIDKMSRREYYLPRVTQYDSDKDIVDFNVPNVGNNDYYGFAKSFGGGGLALPDGKTVTTSPVYLLEGKYEPEKTDADAKNYSMSISVNGADTGYEYLTNLDRLPRNTHVVVNIVFGVSDVTWTVDLRPYGEVKLDPDFGLDRD